MFLVIDQGCECVDVTDPMLPPLHRYRHSPLTAIIILGNRKLVSAGLRGWGAEAALITAEWMDVRKHSSFMYPLLFCSSVAAHFKAAFLLYTSLCCRTGKHLVLFKGDIFYKGRETLSALIIYFCFCRCNLSLPLSVQSECSVLLCERCYRCDKCLCLKVPVSAGSVVLEERKRASVTTWSISAG